MSARALTLALVASLLAAAAATQAWATGTQSVVAVDNDFTNDGLTDSGHEATFDNQGSDTHNVTAEAQGPDGKALFRTGNTPGGAMRLIGGTEFISTGDYPFVCTIHPGMAGVFEVSDRPSDPLPRPEIELKVKSRKLEKVVDREKLKVEVSSEGSTDAEGISLRARKGKKGVTKKEALDLGAGDEQTAKLKLKDKAVDKLEDLDKAKVKVEGTVDFGFGDKAKKKLK